MNIYVNGERIKHITRIEYLSIEVVAIYTIAHDIEGKMIGVDGTMAENVTHYTDKCLSFTAGETQ